MKRFAISLITSVLAFTAGLVTASSWSSRSKTLEIAEPVTVNVSQPCPPNEPKVSTTPVLSYSVTPPRELDFGHNGLRLVPEQVKLKSESKSYDIDVSFPQILPTPYTDTANIERVNQQIKDVATKLYKWPLDPGAQLSNSQVHSGIRNTVNFTYHVGLATDSVLSLNFVGYSYNGAASRQMQDGFSINYDLTSGKQLKLADLFKPHSKYLEFLSGHCLTEISKRTRFEVKTEALSPVTENFDDWQLTPSGISFYFKTCEVLPCSDGNVEVEISFDDLQLMLKPGIPSQFKITYP